MGEQTRNCPTCGQPVPLEASYCGYCGHDFSGNFAGSPTANPATPYGQPAGSGFGWIRGLIIFITLATMIGIGVIFFMVGNEIDGVLDDVGVDFDAGGLGGNSDELTGKGSFQSGKALVTALNEGGFACKRYNLITENQSVEAGTCFQGAEAISVQVYFDKLSFDSVVSNYISNDAIHVAYGKNWTVMVSSPKIAKSAAKALDGKVG